VIRFFKKYWWILLAFLIAAVLFNLDEFLDPILSIPDRFEGGSWFHRFSSNNSPAYDQIEDTVVDTVVDAIDKISHFDFTSFMMDLIIWIMKSINYFISYGFNLLVAVLIWITGFISNEVYKVRTTKAAAWFIRLQNRLQRIRNRLKALLSWVWRMRGRILIFFAVVALSRGLLISILSEVLISVIHYFISAFSTETHIYLFEVFKSAILVVALYVPLPVTIMGIAWFFITESINLATKKLEKNLYDFRAFVKFETHQFCIIVGPPSVGKTRLNVQLCLAAEENYIVELEEILHDIEMQEPEINWGEIERSPYQHMEQFPEHYYYMCLILDGVSMIASAPFAILDPYADGFSIMLKSCYLKPLDPKFQAALEEYKVFSWSEIDKEYNSHYTKEAVGEDGMYITFGTFSHWTKRHSKFFLDYQQATQVPLNLRGCADKFLKVREYTYRYPFPLSLVKAPFDWIFNLVDRLIVKYESVKSRISKNTRRRGAAERKRFDYTLIYSVLRYWRCSLAKILLWFSKFDYIKFKIDLQDKEDVKVGSVALRVNCQDESWRGSRLYESVFLSEGYEAKKPQELRWETLQRYSSLKPTPEELKELDFNFINQSFFEEQQQTNVSTPVGSSPVPGDDAGAEEPPLQFR